MYKAQPNSKIEWPAAYFHACSEREKFQDVRLVTAASEFTTKVEELTKTVLHLEGVELDEIAAQSLISIYENVTVDAAGITICINAANVTDDNVVIRALDMLADALYQLNGEYGTINFGGALSFNSSDTPWLVRH